MKIGKALERIAAAVAFAEAGQWDTAVDLMNQPRERGQILVACEGVRVGTALLAHAAGVAERLRCDITLACIAAGDAATRLTTHYANVSDAVFDAAFEREVEALHLSRREVGLQTTVLVDDFIHGVNVLCEGMPRVEFAILGCARSDADHLFLKVPYFLFR